MTTLADSMKAMLKIARVLIFALLFITAPFISIGVIFGLAGSTAKYYLLVLVGYVGLLISSLIGIFRPKFLFFSVIPLALIVVGATLDSSFWTRHNAEFCSDLRREPSCVEDACGFTCSNFNGMGFTTAGTVCADKDMSLCQPYQPR